MFPSFHPQDLAPALVAMLSLLGFLIYHFFTESDSLKNWLDKRYGNQASINAKLIRDLTGALLIGALPLLGVFLFVPEKTDHLGLSFHFPLLPTLGLMILFTIAGFFTARNPETQKRYPLIRIPVWSRKIVLLNALGWILYIFAYEFAFRGLLLFSWADAYGVWPAIVFNIVVYSFAHAVQGPREAFASIPLGLVFCLLAVYAGSFFPAFLVHITISLSGEMFALRFNPHISIK